MNEITAAPTLDLSLYHLDEGLQGLLEYQQERLTDRENPPDAEELAALDAEIRKYAEAIPRKVAGTAAVRRSWKNTVETAEAEIKRLRGIVAHVNAMIERLDGYCVEILERQPKPAKGGRKLTGADGSVLSLRTNGGLLPLLPNPLDPAVLPDECCRMVGWINADEWLGICHVLTPQRYSLTRQPDNEAIRAKLAEPCPTCMGAKDDPSDDRRFADSCPTCGGTGKNAISGARLGERGAHIEVR